MGCFRQLWVFPDRGTGSKRNVEQNSTDTRMMSYFLMSYAMLITERKQPSQYTAMLEPTRHNFESTRRHFLRQEDIGFRI